MYHGRLDLHLFALALIALVLVGCSATPQPQQEPVIVKAMTYNLWGQMRGDRLAEIIDSADVGIIAMQEIGDGRNLDEAARLLGPNWTALYPGKDTPDLKQPPGRRPNFWVGGHHMPAGLITKYEVVEHQYYNIKDTPDDWVDARLIECYRSCLRVRLKIDNNTFVNVFSLHGNPWNSQWRIREFRDVIGQLDQYHYEDPTIILGDFNAIPHTDNPEDPNDAAATQQLIDAGFVDSFRQMHPDIDKHPGTTNESGRIDHIYVRNFDKIIDSTVVMVPAYGIRENDSDHHPLLSTLQIWFLRLEGHPPTASNSCKSTTTATSFRRRPTSCPRSISTASDRCRTPGHDKAAGRPDSERLHADAGKTPRQGGRHALQESPSGPREARARGSRAAHQLGKG